jgi:putative redox protein
MALSVTGELSAEQRARLLQIANACPVHKVLTAGVTVETELAS